MILQRPSPEKSQALIIPSGIGPSRMIGGKMNPVPPPPPPPEPGLGVGVGVGVGAGAAGAAGWRKFKNPPFKIKDVLVEIPVPTPSPIEPSLRKPLDVENPPP